ncbi:glycosyl transferase [Leptolyngbya sp. Heron Island J]|uniref:glycosyltransferase n=1 Tax=Leptolyngbya sp. Heron Island J TaxID=1385935 RepID=UPI0003B9A5EB|nr:glycosyltransferase family A protein [Leptolyngbya sp. Heron Island J]ESA37698.1 glycosyl transferase [Leptolyngbya sp. Heron Island J]
MKDTLTPHPFVTVIIPVYNDSKRLQQCLNRLQNQTYSQACYEVIVIDNNSTEDLKPIVDQFAQAKYLVEKKPGSYSARNTGLAIAKGEILGFTDSDCVPAFDWIEKGADHILKHPGCGLVAGKIDFLFQQSENPKPTELFDSLYFLQQEKYVKEGHFAATANLFTTPAIFSSVGLFDDSLKSGGDREWGKRVYAAGYKQIYAADVKISHPTRTSFEEINKKLCRVYKGGFYINKKSETPLLEFLKEIIVDVKPPARYLFKTLEERGVRDINKRITVIFLYMRLKLSKAFTELKLYFQ